MALSNTQLIDLLNPASTILLVVDKQYGYFERQNIPTEGLKSAVVGIDAFIEVAREMKVPVIWTQMVENKDESPEHLSFIMKQDEQYVPLTEKGTRSFEFYGDIVPNDNETVIEKHYYNAFAHTELLEAVRQHQAKSIIIVGGYASRCILATTIGAVDAGLHVVIPPELVGNTDNTENEVSGTLNVIRSIYGFLLSKDEILSAWSENTNYLKKV